MLRLLLLAAVVSSVLPVAAVAAPDERVMAFLKSDLKGAGDHPFVGR